jgi:hypothetical protein
VYRINLVITFIFALSLATVRVKAQAYTYTEIVVPGLSGPTAASINNHGDIVGYGTGSTGTVGFLDSGGNFTLLSVPGSTSTEALGINDAGDIVGFYTDGSGTHGFKYTAGSYTTIDAPLPADANTTKLNAINNVGQMLGSADTASGLSDPFVDTSGAFSFVPLYACESVPPSNPETVNLNGINDSGQIVGFFNPCSYHPDVTPIYGTVAAFQRATSFGGGDGFRAINDGGQVILYTYNGRTYLQSSATQQTLGTPIVFPGPNYTLGLGLNNAGTIVGSYQDSANVIHAFLAISGAPTCVVGTSSGPPSQMIFSAQDGSGLGQIVVTAAINATTTIPSFVSGATSPIVVTSQATNPAQTASVTLTATNTSGLSSSCSARIGGTGAPWTGLGGVLTSNVGAGLNQSGSLDLFGLGTDSALWHIPQSGPGGPWGSWSSLGGSSSSEPVVVTDAAGQIEIFEISADGTLWQISQTAPGDWSGATWNNIASGVKGRPAVVRGVNDQLQAFVRANDDWILGLTQNSPGSSSWLSFSVGGMVTSNPAAALVSTSPTEVDVAAIGTDGALWITRPGSGTWSSLGGSLKGDPSLISQISLNGGFYAFSRGTDDALWELYPSPQSLGGILVNNPRAIVNSDGRPEVFVAGTDNAVWHTALTVGGGSEWSPWSSLGGVIVGDVTPALDASGAINLLAIGSDYGLWNMTQPSPGSWQ